MPSDAIALRIAVNAQEPVSALLRVPSEAKAALVLAHGAGAGMEHPFMETVATELASHKIATLRFQFPYMEQRSKRPDSPGVAHAAVRAAVAQASRRLTDIPLFAGGKSFGGRMTSQAHSEDPLPGVLGLVFLGFPLHPAGKPSVKRAHHLASVQVPMLFLQGTRDALADLALLEEVLAQLGDRATLETIDDADHTFHVRKSSGSTDELVLRALAARAAKWMSAIVSSSSTWKAKTAPA
ncbi:MAG: alpha/beta hydrolase family protein [Burkholderiaceae bacterium]